MDNHKTIELCVEPEFQKNYIYIQQNNCKNQESKDFALNQEEKSR